MPLGYLFNNEISKSSELEGSNLAWFLAMWISNRVPPGIRIAQPFQTPPPILGEFLTELLYSTNYCLIAIWSKTTIVLYN